MKLGDIIQHVSGTGREFEIIKVRPEHGDMLAATLDADTQFTRVINPDNWRIVRESGLPSADLSRLIVRVLHLAGQRIDPEDEIDPSTLMFVMRVKARYSELKSDGHDFGTASDMARAEVVEQILRDHGL